LSQKLGPDLSGRALGPYEILERIGEGGMAVVYRAVQQSLGREVALKVLSAELGVYDIYVERFRDEARTLARLEHPHILPIYDLGTAEGQLYIATPLVRGGTVRDQLLGPPLPVELAWKYLSQVADALQHAHQVGIIHRDLKPSNMLVHPDGRTVLGDFGVARLGGSHMTLSASGNPVGTPGYMSPEQALGAEVDGRADIYSLAVTAFELLTGGRPFPGLDPKHLVN
jgi:serine/threonine protein kinase